MMSSQQALVRSLTEAMNDADTSWAVASNFELPELVRTLTQVVPAFGASEATENGFAYSSAGAFSWICVDAHLGTAAFIIPDRITPAFIAAIPDPLITQASGLTVEAAIYGAVDDSIWQRIGENRRVVAASEFLTK